jgi:TolB protein
VRRGVLICVLAALVLPAPAQAAFPGQNGELVFERASDIWTISADGSGETQLTSSGAATDSGPRWSPDGKKIAFLRVGTVQPYTREIWVMNADGSSQVPILDCSGLPVTDCAIGEPAWSPEGTEIAWGFDDHCNWGGLWIANADGTDPIYSGCPGDRDFSGAAWSPDGAVIAIVSNLGEQQIFLSVAARGAFSSTQITNVPVQHFDPDWSPGGDRLVVFFDDWDTFAGLITMNRDGTDRTPIRPGGRMGAWSPDGTRIAFVDVAGGGIRTMDPDGSNESADLTLGDDPDWQPIPVTSYPRPKGASPMRVSLVTAYGPCGASNRTHGPPLSFPSCNPPAKESQHLTVGTGDSNMRPARNEGFLRLRAVRGNLGTAADEADIAITFFSDDVFNLDLTDYTGELRASVPITITDRDNTPHPGGPGAATTQEFDFTVDATCVAVADPREGSYCQTSTSADALIPGAIKEGRRSVWQLGQVVVYDGGADGDTATAGNTVFARQGVFIP